MATQDQFTRKWIIENGTPIVKMYRGELTLRALHYRLVAIGMTNTQQHYKRVVAAMGQARWDGVVDFSDFVDHDRQLLGETRYQTTNVYDEIENAKESIQNWMEAYYKNRWENQPYYIEVWIEKKALQSVFDKPCMSNHVALAPCKGYPSLTYINDAADRFNEAKAEGKTPLIIYFGDYDPSGEDIPRSLEDTLYQLGAKVEVKRIALMEEQVRAWKLPPAPAKTTDSRTANWDGLGQVELDAVEPNKLKAMANDAIEEYFDRDLYEELLKQEKAERKTYVKALKEHVKTL